MCNTTHTHMLRLTLHEVLLLGDVVEEFMVLGVVLADALGRGRGRSERDEVVHAASLQPAFLSQRPGALHQIQHADKTDTNTHTVSLRLRE